MDEQQQHIIRLEREIEELKNNLFEANAVIDAIREGSVDALVLTKEGIPHVYSIESADYTYRVLIEKFGEGALSISPDGLILYCNDYFAKLVKLPASRITGTYFENYLETGTEFAHLKEALDKGSSKGEITLNLNGTSLSVYISLTDLHPNVNAVGMIINDLSEIKKHEQALEQYRQKLEHKVDELHLNNTNLEQFIHVISHDLKEPVRKIIMYTTSLSERAEGLLPPNEIKQLGIVNSSARRLNSLVDDLVKYAFSASEPEVEEVGLTAILQDVVSDLELYITDTDTQIVIGELPSITGSKVQMRQLFSNLVTNAIKYGKQDSRPLIEISASVTDNVDVLIPDKKYYQISIKDNGIGMDESNQTKIFTIFQRLHLRNEYSGNGIGLSICKKIMENHDGKIGVKSKPGKGSTFKLFFPVNKV